MPQLRIKTRNNAALGGALSDLVSGLLPNPKGELDAAYRRAQIDKIGRENAKQAQEMALVREQELRSADLANAAGDRAASLLPQTHFQGDLNLTQPELSAPQAVPANPNMANPIEENFARAFSESAAYENPGDAIKSFAGQQVLQAGDEEAVRRAMAVRGTVMDTDQAITSQGVQALPVEADAGYDYGSGMDAQLLGHMQRIQDLYDAGQPVSPADERIFNFGKHKLGVDSVDTYTDRNGVVRRKEIPGNPLTGFGQPQPATAPVAQADPAAAAPAPTAPAAAGVGDPAAGVVDPDVMYDTGQGVKRTEAQARNLNFAVRATSAGPHLDAVTPENVISKADFILALPKEGVMSTMVTGMMASDEAQAYMASANQFLSAVLRLDTGAAAPIHEYPQYWAQFIPLPWNGPETLARKKEARALAITTMQANANVTPAELIAIGVDVAGDQSNDPHLQQLVRDSAAAAGTQGVDPDAELDEFMRSLNGG